MARLHLIRNMISNFVSLPLFRITDIPLRETLSLLMKKDFFQPATAFSEDLRRAQELHTSLATNSTSQSPDLAQYHVDIAEFYRLIQDISLRFPDNFVSFEWFSTLRYNPTSRRVTTWELEQAHLVYQLGAVICQEAHDENISHEEGARKACLFLKRAAGCFQMLLQLASDAPDTSPLDFDKATSSTLKLLMLAQAQEVVWLKAASNPSTKNTLVARLSKKIADLYEEAITYSLQSKTIIFDWTNHMRVKMFHFLAVSYYRMSIVALDNFEYGNQVAYLKAASKKCVEGLKHTRYVEPKVIQDLQGLIETVDSILRTAEKENNFVFLKPVPSFQELPSIVAVSMVEPEIPQELIEEKYKPAFATLVPFGVIQIAQAFKEREEEYVRRSFLEPLLALGRMLHQFLAARDLPATIDTIQKPESIPDSIMRHLKEIATIGGIKIIEDSMSEISDLALKSRNLIFECEERMRMESYEDEILRERAVAAWNRQPSKEVNTNFASKIQKMQNYIQQGHQSDVLIGDSYENMKPALKAYCGGRETLQRNIPSSSYVKLDPELSKLVNELKELISHATKLETARHKFVSGMRGKSRNSSILPTVLSQYKRNPLQFQHPNGSIDPAKFEPIYEEHLRLYAHDLAFLEKQKLQQTQLEKQIDESNLQLTRSKEILKSAAQQKRLKALQFFENVYVQYLELIANLSQASAFYIDFLEKGNGVLRELEGFLYSRREEARELTIGIQNQQKFSQIEHSMGASSKIAAPQSVRPKPVRKISENH